MDRLTDTVSVTHRILWKSSNWLWSSVPSRTRANISHGPYLMLSRRK